jgi:hypothetical protein
MKLSDRGDLGVRGKYAIEYGRSGANVRRDEKELMAAVRHGWV